nr:MAG TPA: hypothetical protein [Caudoviricetes sp.]
MKFFEIFFQVYNLVNFCIRTHILLLLMSNFFLFVSILFVYILLRKIFHLLSEDSLRDTFS